MDPRQKTKMTKQIHHKDGNPLNNEATNLQVREVGEPTPDRLVMLYGNAYEAKVDGKSLGWFATEDEARRAMRIAKGGR